MSSAFRNFFISFILCLLILGYVSYAYLWPAISAAVDFNGETSTPQTSVSRPDDVSRDPQDPNNNTNKHDGTELTYLLVGEAADGSIGAVIFIRVDEGAGTFTYCSIPVSTVLNNDVGKQVPISTLLAGQSMDVISRKISAMVGYKPDYYVRVDMSFVLTLIEKLHNPHFQISRPITCVNPKYEDDYTDYFEVSDDGSSAPEQSSQAPVIPDPDDGSSEDTEVSDEVSAEPQLPEDYYITIPAGTVKLDGDSVFALMKYSVAFNNPVDMLITTDLYHALFVQYMTSASTKRNTSVAKELLAVAKETNITDEVVSTYNNFFFTYDEYKMTKVAYSNWVSTVEAFKNAD